MRYSSKGWLLFNQREREALFLFLSEIRCRFTGSENGRLPKSSWLSSEDFEELFKEKTTVLLFVWISDLRAPTHPVSAFKKIKQAWLLTQSTDAIYIFFLTLMHGLQTKDMRDSSGHIHNYHSIAC